MVCQPAFANYTTLIPNIFRRIQKAFFSLIHMGPRFEDRFEAGRFLAERLQHHANDPSVVVLALPRGGVPVGCEIAQALNAPLDVFVVRKLGVPGYEELAMGAIASGGVRVLNEEVVSALPNADQLIESVTARELAEVERREQAYRDGRPAPEIRGRVVI